MRIVLAHKGLLEKVEYRPVHLVKDGGEQLRTEYTTLNKFAQVPTLAVGGSSITQSLAIIEYLEEVYPTPSILPGDALDRAAARQFAECINSGIQPLQNLATLKQIKALVTPDATGLGPAAMSWANQVIGDGLTKLESMAAQSAGKFAVGDAVSLADACLVPQLYNARRFSVVVEEFPTLAAIERECMELQAFQDADCDRQPDADA